MKPIRIALTKGRLEKKTMELFESLGYDCTALHNKGQKADFADSGRESGNCAGKGGGCHYLCRTWGV